MNPSLSTATSSVQSHISDERSREILRLIELLGATFFAGPSQANARAEPEKQPRKTIGVACSLNLLISKGIYSICVQVYVLHKVPEKTECYCHEDDLR